MEPLLRIDAQLETIPSGKAGLGCWIPGPVPQLSCVPTGTFMEPLLRIDAHLEPCVAEATAKPDGNAGFGCWIVTVAQLSCVPAGTLREPDVYLGPSVAMPDGNVGLGC